jgi:cbb3-type cytochrome oxidase subunit 3
LIGLALIYYGYVAWVLLKKKRTSNKKDSEKLAYLHLNNKFVNKSNNEQTDLGAVLDQIDEVEDTSKLLEAFKEGSLDDDSNSLTRKKHEKLKIIRNTDMAEDDPPDSET